MSNARPVRVQFLFDFGSPKACLSDRVVPDIEKRTSVTFDDVPVLLGGIFAAKSQDQAIENRLMELTQDAVDRVASANSA